MGLIWLVQVVAYPLFARVGAADFARYHATHARQITFVVAPLMLAELGSSLAILYAPDPLLPLPALQLGAALGLAVWLCTFFAAVPQHGVLAHGFDPRAHQRLLAANWARTLLWTARAGLVLWAVARMPVCT
jgi:hypothetical protein